jgi:serine protease
MRGGTVFGGLGLLIVALGCSGLGSDLTGASLTIPNVILASNGISADLERGPAPRNIPARTRQGQYVVQLKEGVGARSRVEGGRVASDSAGFNDLASKAGFRNARRVHGEAGSARNPSGKHQDTLHVESDMSLGDLQQLAKDNADIEFIEPVIEYDAFAGGLNDEFYAFQWNMEKLQLPVVLQKQTGKGIVVAVLDSGVSPGPDGLGNLLRGYDFVDDDTDASDTDNDKMDSGSHGTHVAGTINQATNNGMGVAGLAPGVSILPVRVMGWMPELGTISSDNETIAAGITWAVDNGADVINMSLGGYLESAVIASALDYAYKRNVVVVAATGNSGYTNQIAFPASHPTVIAVGAVGPDGREPAYSNTGPGIAIVAPGGDLAVDVDGDGYGDGIVQETIAGGQYGYAFFQGTSMASPHVAAAAALLLANGLRTPDEVREALTATATNMGKPYGALDVLAALDYAPTGGRVGRGGKGADRSGAARGEGGRPGEGRPEGREGAGDRAGVEERAGGEARPGAGERGGAGERPGGTVERPEGGSGGGGGARPGGGERPAGRSPAR